MGCAGGRPGGAARLADQVAPGRGRRRCGALLTGRGVGETRGRHGRTVLLPARGGLGRVSGRGADRCAVPGCRRAPGVGTRHLVGGRGRMSASSRAGDGRRTPGSGQGQQRKRRLGDRHPGQTDNVVMSLPSRCAISSACTAGRPGASKSCRGKKPGRLLRSTKTSIGRRGDRSRGSPLRLRAGNPRGKSLSGDLGNSPTVVRAGLFRAAGTPGSSNSGGSRHRLRNARSGRVRRLVAPWRAS